MRCGEDAFGNRITHHELDLIKFRLRNPMGIIQEYFGDVNVVSISKEKEVYTDANGKVLSVVHVDE